VSAEYEPSPLSALRRERIAACLLESMPTDDEIERVRRRRKLRAAPRRQTRGLVVALVYGVVLGLASAAAAAFVADGLTALDPPPRADRPETPRVAAASRAISARSPRRTPAAAAVQSAPATVAFPELAPEPVDRPAALSPAPKPRSVAAASARARASEHRLRPVPVPPAPAPARAGAAVPAAPSVASLAPLTSEASGPWERAAKALAAGDWNGADKALTELDRSDDVHARDAATLARAQLRITQGRGAEVRPALERLASGGATPLIRRRAAALLDSL
jgi:hypothetical protein